MIGMKGEKAHKQTRTVSEITENRMSDDVRASEIALAKVAFSVSTYSPLSGSYF